MMRAREQGTDFADECLQNTQTMLNKAGDRLLDQVKTLN
jgi:hypothetical protein